MLPRCCYHGVVTTVLLPRCCYRGVVTALMLPRCCYRADVTAVLLPRCCYRGVVIAVWLSLCGYRSVVTALMLPRCCYRADVTAVLLPQCWYRGVVIAMLLSRCCYSGAVTVLMFGSRLGFLLLVVVFPLAPQRHRQRFSPLSSHGLSSCHVASPRTPWESAGWRRILCSVSPQESKFLKKPTRKSRDSFNILPFFSLLGDLAISFRRPVKLSETCWSGRNYRNYVRKSFS